MELGQDAIAEVHILVVATSPCFGYGLTKLPYQVLTGYGPKA